MKNKYLSIIIKGWEIGKIAYRLYILILLIVDETSYGIVWYGSTYGGSVYFIVIIYVMW